LNEVVLTGKVSRLGQLKYTPAGSAITEITLAATQEYFKKSTMGHFDIVLLGDLAEEKKRLRIGTRITVKGNLWSRKYTDRRGNKVVETKVIANTLIGEEK